MLAPSSLLEGSLNGEQLNPNYHLGGRWCPDQRQEFGPSTGGAGWGRRRSSFLGDHCPPCASAWYSP
eukprot:1161076-Pelagomonas_calceolata.AAC.1